eukprot:gene8488-14486_t
MDTKIRKILTCNRMHHPKADVDRLYLPRRQGGRGMIQLELSYTTSAIGLMKYLETTKDWMLQLVKDHENQKKLHSIVKESRNFERELKVENNERQGELEEATKEAKKLKVKVKAVGQKMLQEKWEQKSLHGKYVLRSKDADVDQTHTHQWLRSAGLKAETEGFLLAAQDQTLSTRNYQANILKNGADPKCRYCNEQCETVDHLVSRCAVLAPNEYKARHDRVGQCLHWKICHHFGVETPKHWYEHHPDPVVEGDNVSILWDFPVYTDRTINAYRPDIIIKDRNEETCLLIDMSIPTDRNISSKEFDKLSKYKDLEIEIQKMWKVKATTVPVIVGALGMIKKGTENHISKIPGEPSLKEIQKIVLTGTAHVLRRALST